MSKLRFINLFTVIILVFFSCQTPPEQQKRDSQPISQKTNYSNPDNRYFQTPELLPETIQKTLSENKQKILETPDSLPISESSWVYSVGADENRTKYFLLIENAGQGSGGFDISVIEEKSNLYYRVQQFFGFFDKRLTSVTKNNRDITLYYQSALKLEILSPVSVIYKWDGKYYRFSGVNEIYTQQGKIPWLLLKSMRVVNDQDMDSIYPFIKKTSTLETYDPNRFHIDTAILHDAHSHRLLFVKNNCADGVYTDHIWVIDQESGVYRLLKEEQTSAPQEFFLIKNKHVPVAIYNGDTIRLKMK